MNKSRLQIDTTDNCSTFLQWSRINIYTKRLGSVLDVCKNNKCEKCLQKQSMTQQEGLC